MTNDDQYKAGRDLADAFWAGLTPPALAGFIMRFRDILAAMPQETSKGSVETLQQIFERMRHESDRD